MSAQQDLTERVPATQAAAPQAAAKAPKTYFKGVVKQVIENIDHGVPKCIKLNQFAILTY